MFFVFRFKALTSIVKVKILELRELLVSLVLREIPSSLHPALRIERGNFKFRFKALDLRISFKVVRIVYHDFLTLGLRIRFKDFYSTFCI